MIKLTRLVILVKQRRGHMQVNILEAKTDFSKLIRLLETGRAESLTVATPGPPVVIMPLYPATPVKNRIGIAEGKFHDPEDFDKYDDEIASLFLGGDA